MLRGGCVDTPTELEEIPATNSVLLQISSPEVCTVYFNYIRNGSDPLDSLLSIKNSSLQFLSFRCFCCVVTSNVAVLVIFRHASRFTAVATSKHHVHALYNGRRHFFCFD